MSFGSDLSAFVQKARRRTDEIFEGTVEAAHESIVYGSPLTGSPGQPEDLRDGQWQTQYELASARRAAAVISTDDPSARSVEDGISYAHGGVPITLKSPIGGFHSVALTRAQFPWIVDDVTKKVVGSDG